MDPASPESRLSRLLAPDERLLWSGRPRQGLLFRAADRYVIPFTLLWCGLVVAWNLGAQRASASPLLRVEGAVFGLVGLYILVGRFAVDVHQRKRTVYGVTDARVIVLSGVVGETQASVPLDGMTLLALTVRPDGSGDIVFGPRTPFDRFLVPGWPGAGWLRATTFDAIPRAREVHDLILRVRSGKE